MASHVSRPARALRRLLHPTLPPLPHDFLFGVGTADHQGEAFDPRFPDVWDDWEAANGEDPGVPVERCVPRGRATDFWERYPEDVDLARRMGCKAFRFSIAWARVEPEPGRFSDEALEHYRRLADSIRAAGMEPVITLMHFVWPRHVEQRGGLRSPEFAGWFGEYAARVRDALGDRCRYWITINEPNALIFGYLKPFWMARHVWPPGLPPDADEGESMRATAEVIRNLFLANREARLALRAGVGGAGRLVSANSYYLGLPDRFGRVPLPLMHAVDWRARLEIGWAEEDWLLREGRFIHRGSLAAPVQPPPDGPLAQLRSKLGALTNLGAISQIDLEARLGPLSKLGAAPALFDAGRGFAALFSFVGSNWWQLGMRGELPEFLCPPECRDQLDYVAFDYYFGTPFLHNVGRLMDVIERRYDRAPVWAAGLHGALRYFAELFPNLPIFVIENGVAGHPNSGRRVRYLRDHVRAVQQAKKDGVNVIGYLAWSLTTNREWGLPSGPRGDFGLYHIDLDGDPTLTRRSTRAVATYAALIRHRGV